LTPNPNIFFYDFNDGVGEGWTVVYGKPVISNEQLMASELTLVSFGDISWTNYQIEFDVKMGRYTCGGDPSFVGFRATDIDNMLLYRFNTCGSESISVINGELVPIPGTVQGNQGRVESFFHITILVEGDKIIVRDQIKVLNSYIDTDHVSGNIYLRIRTETVFDNFKITLLP
jgi:hypothetical protein